MRKESKREIRAQVADINHYHWGSFDGHYYFNSDRKEEIVGGMRKNGQPLCGFGTETEIECTGIMNTRVLAECIKNVMLPHFKFGASMFKLEKDGSLGGDTSVEMISQVMTKARIRNDYAAYKLMYNTYFPSFGLCSDANKTSCGMHVNVSNAVFGKTEEEQKEAIRKLHYLLGKHFQLMARALYRPIDKTYWCDRMDRETMVGHGIREDIATKYDWRNAKLISLVDAPSAHHCALNMSHFREGRIEIRLVGGQKDYFSYRNTMETVFFLTERVRSLKWSELNDLTIVFKGCNQYVNKRLASECGDYLTQNELTDIYRNIIRDDLEIG